MFRTTDLVLIGVMIAAAAFTYTTKHGAEAELAKARKLEASIRLERDAIDVLKADWSLLTQPSRLQRLTQAFEDDLQLYHTEPYQYGDIAELPPTILQIDDIIDGFAAGDDLLDLDGILTGGVTR